MAKVNFYTANGGIYIVEEGKYIFRHLRCPYDARTMHREGLTMSPERPYSGDVMWQYDDLVLRPYSGRMVKQLVVRCGEKEGVQHEVMRVIR